MGGDEGMLRWGTSQSSITGRSVKAFPEEVTLNMDILKE